MVQLLEQLEAGLISKEEFTKEAAYRDKSSKFLEALVGV